MMRMRQRPERLGMEIPRCQILLTTFRWWMASWILSQIFLQRLVRCCKWMNLRQPLIQCMDAKIAAFQNKVYDWSVKEAFSSYQIAGLTDDADAENKMDKIHDAWADHVNVIRSKFVTPDDALFVYTLLQSSTIANLMTTFTLVSTDYLKYLALTKSSNFDK